jgi:hypothetical protein
LSTKCRHKAKASKVFTSVWTIPDILKALKENYEITDIYEVHFFRETKFLLRPFVQCLSSLRLKNSGGLEKLDTEEEKLRYCNFHNEKMHLPASFALTPSNIKNNLSQKTLYKEFSNSSYSKFSQMSKSRSEIVTSQHRLEEIATIYEILDFYPINENSLLVEFESCDLKPNLTTNVYIGSEISAHGRVIIHDHIRSLQQLDGIKVFAVDTDCVFYSIRNDVQDPIVYSDAFGDFKSVIPDGCDVLAYYSLGCRNYSILYQDQEKKLHSVIKCKGLSLKSAHLQNNLTVETYKEFVESHFNDELKTITFGQIRRKEEKPNPHFKTTFTTFEFRNDLFLKRYVDKNLTNFQTFPFGYVPS